jgi:tRNA uridine 5-carboxymethylaminomethyl modification enzyme
MLFAATWREMLENTPKVEFYQDMVNGLIIEKGFVRGVVTGMGNRIYSKSVVLTNGTFLNGIIHIGEKQFGGGRMAEKAATGITEQLVSLGFESSRLKTGTPPRIDGRSLDYSKMEEQKGDDHPVGFSYQDIPLPKQQRSCWITYTNPLVHNILKTGFDRSPMFTGRIDGIGPRYCPSIEDKLNRFADKERHQLFIEPEGWNTVEIYVNGFSTSLPEETQYEALRNIPGFAHFKAFRPGYAIEYDYFPPTQLGHTLETKIIKNLFLAGQINGTTGYEEAACQGLMAGINAHQNINFLDPVILDRSEAYIGVLIDDLISKGTEEPYRMFTSRAEFRTLLRQDNADIRLTEKSFHLGLASSARLEAVNRKKMEVTKITRILQDTSVDPKEAELMLSAKKMSPLIQKQKAATLLLRPNLDLSQMREGIPVLDEKLREFAPHSLEQAEIQLKYEVYIKKEKELVQRISQLEQLSIPESFDYDRLSALSMEALIKFKKIKPRTLGQASRISGVNPTDIQILMVYMGR